MVLEFVGQVGAGNVRQTGVVADGMGLVILVVSPLLPNSSTCLPRTRAVMAADTPAGPVPIMAISARVVSVHGGSPLYFLYTLILSLFYHRESGVCNIFVAMMSRLCPPHFRPKPVQWLWGRGLHVFQCADHIKNLAFEGCPAGLAAWPGGAASHADGADYDAGGGRDLLAGVGITRGQVLPVTRRRPRRPPS